MESNCEKVDRLVELHLNYQVRVDHLLARQKEEHQEEDEDEDEDEDDYVSPEERKYLERLEGGLFTLQRIDLITGRLIVSEGEIRKHFTSKIKEQGGSVEYIVNVLEEYKKNLGDEGSETSESDIEQLKKTIDVYCAALSQ